MQDNMYVDIIEDMNEHMQYDILVHRQSDYTFKCSGLVQTIFKDILSPTRNQTIFPSEKETRLFSQDFLLLFLQKYFFLF